MWKWKWLTSVQLCDPMDYIPWNSPGQNTGVGSLSLLQGIFPTEGLNPGLPHCWWILYQLSHKRSPRILEWVAYPFSRGSSPPRSWTWVSCIAGGFFPNWAIREALWKQYSLLVEEFAYQRGGEEISDIELEEDSCVSPSDHTYNPP